MKTADYYAHQRRRHMRMAIRCGRVSALCFFGAGFVLPQGKIAGAGLLAVLGLICMVATFELDEAHATAEQVLSVLNIAGRAVGVGDWRPDKGGIYGRFTAELLTTSAGKSAQPRQLAAPKPRAPSKPLDTVVPPDHPARERGRGKSKAARAMDRAIMAG